MSRIKSSRLMSATSIMQVDEEYKYAAPPKSTVTSDDMVCGMYARVPDIKVNPKQPDGYRSPSNYSLHHIAKFPRITSSPAGNRYLLPADILDSKVVSDHAYVTVTRTLSGSTIVAASLAPRSSTWALQQELRMKILNNIKDEAFNAAMVLAEIGKTANTAAGLMLRIGRSMDALRMRKRESFNWLMHGRMGADNRRPTEKFLKETAGLFLEWKYGIMPTVYDLEGMTKSLDAAKDGSLFDRPPLMVARSHVKRRETLKCGLSFEHGLSNYQPDHSCEVETTLAGRADFTVSGEGMRDLSEYGIGLTTVATVAYDLTPFSFVANMICPMAELISAWGALAGVDLRGYTETTYDKYMFPKRHVTVPARNLGGNATVSIGATEYSEFSRTGSTSIPFPLPFIRNPVKVGNAATVLALFTQLRARPKREPKLFGFDNKDL